MCDFILVMLYGLVFAHKIIFLGRGGGINTIIGLSPKTRYYNNISTKKSMEPIEVPENRRGLQRK